MDIDNIYKQLTGIDIDEQKEFWDERGKGYYGEYLLFCMLHGSLPGCSKILMNLNIPVSEQKTTEIDLLLLHETGLYVFEIKHFKGTIYGNSAEERWTQYFRTAPNSTFKNPILQNDYHISALQKLFPNVPIYSFIVFTSPDCDLRVTSEKKGVAISHIDDVSSILKDKFSTSEPIFSMEEIDQIFNKLSGYSQMQTPIVIDGKEADFSSWVAPTISELTETKKALEKEQASLQQEKKKTRITRILTIAASAIVVTLAIGLSISIVTSEIDKNNARLSHAEQTLLLSTSEGERYLNLDALNPIVSDVSFSAANSSFIRFSAKLTVTHDVYGLALTESSKYLVTTTSGEVLEYDIFGEHLSYRRYSNMLGKNFSTQGVLKTIEFRGISRKNEIKKIAISGVEIFQLEDSAIIANNLSITLYTK